MKVLVVDDSSAMRRIHQRSLEQMGCTVIQAVDGVEGLAKLKTDGPYDLVLTDLHMPNMDGLELIAQLRRDAVHGKTKVLMVTSDGVLETVEKAMAAGADDLLVKPFRPDVFVAKVRSLVSG